MPIHSHAYVHSPLQTHRDTHRVGRTARAGHVGTAITLLQKKEVGLLPKLLSYTHIHTYIQGGQDGQSRTCGHCYHATAEKEGKLPIDTRAYVHPYTPIHTQDGKDCDNCYHGTAEKKKEDEFAKFNSSFNSGKEAMFRPCFEHLKINVSTILQEVVGK